jgi:hypothetical protein
MIVASRRLERGRVTRVIIHRKSTPTTFSVNGTTPSQLSLLAMHKARIVPTHQDRLPSSHLKVEAG